LLAAAAAALLLLCTALLTARLLLLLLLLPLALPLLALLALLSLLATALALLALALPLLPLLPLALALALGLAATTHACIWPRQHVACLPRHFGHRRRLCQRHARAPRCVSALAKTGKQTQMYQDVRPLHARHALGGLMVMLITMVVWKMMNGDAWKMMIGLAEQRTQEAV
jgi:hypothetical protein